MGVMYTEYLDAILAPQVCNHPLLSLYNSSSWRYISRLSPGSMILSALAHRMM